MSEPTPAAAALAQSREAHTAYRTLTNPRQQMALRQQLLSQAHDARQRAHDADPAHTDAAWGLDQANHAELMAFYRAQLAR